MIIEIPDNCFCEEELNNTPNRFKKFLNEWLIKSNDFEFTLFKNDKNYDEMIVVKDISFYSMCGHHLIPFFGKAHIGYIPNKLLCGLSKIPRTVDKFAHKPQLQERLTIEIKDFLVEKLKPLWLMVILEAEHLCISMRGINKPSHLTITSAIYSDSKTTKNDNISTKSEFLSLIKK